MTKIPKSIRRITDHNTDVYRMMDEFFASIRNELKEHDNQDGPSYFTIINRGLCEHTPDPIYTDDRIAMLKYKDRVVAVVTETRTEFNNVQFDFFKNLEGLLESP